MHLVQLHACVARAARAAHGVRDLTRRRRLERAAQGRLQLADAPAVTGYGPLSGVPIVLETRAGTVRLHAGRGAFALDGRPVRYRVPEEVCRSWAVLCK